MRLSTRLAIAMVSLVVLTTAVLGAITYFNIIRLGLPRALERLETHALLDATILEDTLDDARVDFLAYRASGAVADMGMAYVNSLTDPLAREVLLQWRKRFEVRFTAELATKPKYASIRVIALEDGGRELVRVDRSGPGGTIRVVPESDFRQNDDRSYFKAAFGLSPRDVYMSPVEYFQDGATAPAAFPVVHVAGPLLTKDGTPFAIGVVDVDLQPEFNRIRAKMADSRQIFVVNERGDYLLHPDAQRGLVAELGAPTRIQTDFPQFEEAMTQDTASGIWTDRNGGRFGVGWRSIALSGGPRLTVINTSGVASLNIGLAAVGNSALIGGALAVLCAIAVGLMLARSLSKPLVEMTHAVEGFSRGEAIPLSVGGSLEMGVLSAAFTSMVADARQKAALLNNIIVSIADPVLVANEHGDIVTANPAAQRLLGIDPGICSVYGAKKFALFHLDGVTPFPIEQSAMSRALRGESVDNLRLVVRGQHSEECVHVIISARPIIDEAGILRGAVTVYHDITRLMKAQEAQAASEQMAQAIIDTTLDAFVQLDGAGTILRWTPHAEAMLGWTRDEAVGKNIRDLIVPKKNHAANAQRLAAVLKNLDEANPGARYEAPSLRRDGTEIITEISLTALRQRDECIINVFLRDVTRSRAAEERLKYAQKMESVGELTGGLAHDFNNMLTVITGTIDILAEAVVDKPELAAITDLIGGAANRGKELTASLLAFARKQPLQPRSTDVNALIMDACKLLQPTLGRQVELRTDLGDGVWPALVDPGQLSSAMVNLAINARDAMPNGGRLLLQTHNVEVGAQDNEHGGMLAPGCYVVLAVSDTGAGIPDAILDRIFEPFFSTKEPGRGTGLGLSMVYGFVMQSGGHIDVRSEEGSGTTFTVYLPKADRLPDGVETADANATLAGGGETILCVEDDVSVRSYVITTLESMGYKTISATNADEALALVDDGLAFDLLFTDIVMPGTMDGRQLAEEVAVRRSPLKVLFTTGYTENHDIISRGRVNPDVLLLAKPYRRADLARMIRTALDLARSPIVPHRPDHLAH